MAVTKIDKKFRFLIGIGITLALAQSVYAEGDRNPAKAKKTIGDLIRGLDNRGSKVQIQKSAVAIPQVQQQVLAPKPLLEVKPPKTSQMLQDSDSDEAKLEGMTDQGIAQLYKLTQQYSRSKNRGELWLRLAELYVEKAKYVEYRLQDEYDKKVEAFNQKKGAKPKFDMSKARDYNLKAIKLYEWFIRDFPKDPKMDQALFFLGYNYTELDQVAKGMTYYQRLTKEFPNSPYVSEAYSALGDYYFDNDKWAESFKAYSEVLKNRRARLYNFAQYKMAWCEYRMGKVKAGLSRLESVIRMSRAAEPGSGQKKPVSRIKLGSEALKDTVLFYAEDGDYKQAKDYFYEIGGEKAYLLMLERYAYFLSDKGNKEQAYYIFKQLLAVNPTAPKAFDYQYQVVSIFATNPNQGLYRQELFSWVENFGPESAWAKANAGNKKLIDDSFLLRESALRNYTLLLHKNAQNSQKPAELKLAQQTYQFYLSKFPTAPKVYEMHFFYGELLYALKNYDGAAKEYQVVADNDPKGKYYELATLNAVLALEKNLKSDEDIHKMVGDKLEAVPFGPAENQFLAAGERYIKNFPKGEKAVEVKFKEARLYYSYNQFDKALPLFKDIVSRHGKTQFAVFSANLILDIYNLRKDYDGLSREGLGLMKNQDLRSQGFSADVKDMVEKAAFKKGQDLEVKKDYEGAAKVFSDFVKNNPQSALYQSAAFNAGVNYERAQKLPEALALYGLVVSAPVKSGDKNAAKIRNSTILLLGRLYEQTAQYDKAAANFEKYVKENPDDKLTPDLYYNMAVIWEGQKDWYKAMGAYQKYFDKSKKRDRTLALYKMASIHEKLKQWKAAEDRYKEFLDLGGTDPEMVVEAVYRIGIMNEKRGKTAEAEKAWARTLATQKSVSKAKPVGLVWAAEAKFKLTDKIYEELVNLRIPANPAKQQDVIKQKLALIAKLNNELSTVIKYDEGNMVIASLATLGMAYDHMAKSILRAPLPSGLNKEELETYKKGIDGIVQPFKQKAVENFSLAINRSYELNYYNKYTKMALDNMSQYDPVKYFEPSWQALPSMKLDNAGVL